MAIARYRIAWSGDSITGPGLTTFYGDLGTQGPLPAAARTFFDAIKGVIPSGITWTFPGGGDVIDEGSGELVSTWSVPAPLPLISTGGGSFARGVGARIAWGTSRIFRSRRVRGSTFIAPLTSASMDADGSITTTAQTTITSAATALLATSDLELVVWSRPGPTWTGTFSPIESALVPDAISWLRSRRT